MLNSQLNDFASAAHLTQVASYFDIVDNAVKTGDTNKRYSISTNTATAPSPPVPAGSWTNIHIAPTADNMCDLYNSFIELRMHVTFQASSSNKVSNLDSHGKPAVWVGYKDAMDCIESYQIVANGQVIYTQPHAIEESYITNLACPDTVKRRDVFSKATVKGIWEKTDTVMTGGLIEFTKDKALNTYTYQKDIYLKIDIRRFLPLSGVKYLPAFVGNLELRVKFSTAGLVCVPMPWTDFIPDYKDQVAITTTLPSVTCAFTPIGKKFSMYYTQPDATSAPGTTTTAINVVSMTVEECYSVLSCFGIDDAIYQQLVQRYTGQSLSFPTQTLTFQAMNGTCSATDTIDLALTSTPRFVDTIFMLFPQTPEYRTCYQNPLFDDFRLTMGGYGSMPDIGISSYGMVNYEMLTNALNANNDLTGLSEDVMVSATQDNSIQWDAALKGLKPKDITNFALAFPVSVDNSFQQGQTSSSPITYQFKAKANSSSFIKNSNTNCVPLMGFLKDSVFAIQLRPSGPPYINIDEYDISSPAGA